MKCPLIKKVVFQELPYVNLVAGDCLKEECAWWDKARGQCVELSKVDAIIAQNSILGEIADKIPTYQQFQR